MNLGVLSNNNSPKCMIKIVLDSVKKRHNVVRTEHAVNRLARSSIYLFISHTNIIVNYLS